MNLLSDNNCANRRIICLFFIYSLVSFFETYWQTQYNSYVRLFLAFFFFCLLLIANFRRLKISQFIYILFLLYYVSSLAWTPNIEHAKLYVLTVIIMGSMLIVSYSCQFEKKLLNDILACFKYTSGFFGVLGLFYSALDPNITGGVRYVLTLNGIYPDPNNLVVFYATGIALSLISFITHYEYRLQRYFNVSIILINSYDIAMTGSRSGLVVLVMLAFLFLLYTFYMKCVRLIIIPLTLSITVYSILIPLYANIDSLNRFLGKSDGLSLYDSTGRADRWIGIYQKYIDGNLLFGNGWGTHSAHNTYLTLITDVGLLGILLFMLPIIDITRKAIVRRDFLCLMLLVTTLIPAFLIDAQNKRFFWNGLILCVLILNSKQSSKNKCLI